MHFFSDSAGHIQIFRHSAILIYEYIGILYFTNE